MKTIKSDGESAGGEDASNDRKSEAMNEFFAWLDAILPTLKNRARFKLRQPVDWEAVSSLRTVRPQGSDPTYVEFLKRFGECHFVRELNWYKLGVRSPLRLRDDELGVGFIVGNSEEGDIGFWESSSSDGRFCFRSVKGGCLCPVDFTSWFRSEFEKIQSSYSKAAWEELVRPAMPFSKSEMRIVKARSLFRWKQIEEGLDDRLAFNVENLSDLYLPYLTVGIKWRDGSVGKVWLDVSHVSPGTICRVEKLLKSGRSAVGAKAFEVEDPEPGIQDRYWEFKKIPEKSGER